MSDLISRQAAIDEIEYELEMINSTLDSMTLDFNARERLRQRRGEAREILNSIQQLPSVTPLPKGHSFIAICDSDFPITEEVIQELKDTAFVGSEDCNYFFYITEIIKTDKAESEG